MKILKKIDKQYIQNISNPEKKEKEYLYYELLVYYEHLDFDNI